MGHPAVARRPSRSGLPWASAVALVVGLFLGLLQPLAGVVAFFAFPSPLGVLFLLCLAVALVAGLIALLVPASGATSGPVVAMSALMALGMLGGNVVAATLHVGFGAPLPVPAPTGPGWSATGNLRVARYDHTATLLSDGRVLVAGGHGPYMTGLSSAELYDPKTGTWTETGSIVGMVDMYDELRATLLGDGRVLVTGIRAQDAELYDPATGTWRATGSLTTLRSSYTATLLPDGRVLVAGGRTTTMLSSTEIYDPATGAWTAAAPMGEARFEHTATLLPDGRVLVAGGTGPTGWLFSAELYDPAANRWRATGTLKALHSVHTAVLLDDGSVLVAGGDRVMGGSESIGTVERYNPASGTWHVAGTAANWLDPTAIRLSDGQVLVMDGRGGLDLYDPRTESSHHLANAGHGLDFTATLLPDGRALMAGGHSLSGARELVLATAHLFEPE
jgi:hypothetical protein